MRILVTWGSKLGGTEGIARIVGKTLEEAGVGVVLERADGRCDLNGIDAVIVGGALYANRWHKNARRFVNSNLAALRGKPVWMFSSGPLSEAADNDNIPPTKEVATLMGRIGALGHATFGGRMPADAKGFPASAMAKKNAGDWRNADRIARWTLEVARALPSAKPGRGHDFPGGSFGRIVGYGTLGWAILAFITLVLWPFAPAWLTLTLRVLAAPIVFAAVAARYFAPPGAREALPVALAFTVIVALLDAGVVAGLVERSFAMFASVAAVWLPYALVFAMTWATGAIVAMMPPEKSRKKPGSGKVTGQTAS